MMAGGVAYFLLKTAFDLWQRAGDGWIGIIGGNLMKGILAGACIGLAVGGGRFVLQALKHQKLSKSLQRYSQTHLLKSEGAIQQRLHEMATRERRIHDTLQQITQTARPSQKIIDTFQSSLAAIQIQRDRYVVKLWEIMLIRWYNSLKPLTGTVKELTYDMCDTRVKRIGEIIARGAEMLQNWSNKPQLTEAQQTCITRLQKALNTCEKVRQDLLSHKAALAVKGLSPLEEHVQTAPSVLTSLQELDAFNILPDVGEFATGFAALEEEYFRLKGEEEVHREFETE
jgi:hypothetical protein